MAMDLSMEYSRTYTDIVMCLRDRRDDDICASWTITLRKEGSIHVHIPISALQYMNQVNQANAS